MTNMEMDYAIMNILRLVEEKWEDKKEWKVKVNKVDKMYLFVLLYMPQCFRVVSLSNPFAR